MSTYCWNSSLRKFSNSVGIKYTKNNTHGYYQWKVFSGDLKGRQSLADLLRCADSETVVVGTLGTDPFLGIGSY